MIFEIPVESFAKAVSAVADAASKTDVREILRQYKCLAAADGTVRLRATDTRVAVEHSVVGATVEQPGECILHAGRLNKIVAEHRTGLIRVEASEAGVKVRCDGGGYTLPHMSVAEFPDFLDKPDEGPAVAVKAGDLAHMIARTKFAVKKKEGEKSKWAMTGILLQFDPSGRVVLAATTGDVMAEATADASPDTPNLFPAGEPLSALIPPAALLLVQAAMSDDGGEVKVRIDKSQVLFRFSTGAVLTRQIEGQFPPHRQFLRTDDPAFTFTASDEFFGTVRRAAVPLDEVSKRVDAVFTQTDDAPTVTMTGFGPGSESEAGCVLPDFQGDGGEPLVVGLLADLFGEIKRGVGKQSQLTAKVWREVGNQKPVFLVEYPGGLATCSLMVPRTAD